MEDNSLVTTLSRFSLSQGGRYRAVALIEFSTESTFNPVRVAEALTDHFVNNIRGVVYDTKVIAAECAIEVVR